jgi:hypothetical protein
MESGAPIDVLDALDDECDDPVASRGRRPGRAGDERVRAAARVER